LQWGLEEVITTSTQAYHTASSGKAASGSSMVPPHTLDAPAIKAAANLATVSTTTPAAENKMVVYNPTTSNYAYHDVPAGMTLPAYIKPTKILMRASTLVSRERY
jgi:hypothetical protein